jgi:acyl carrier protein
MDRTALRAEILALAARQGLRGEPADDADLAAHLDSLQRLALVVAIEDHFAICFDPEDDTRAATLGGVVDVVAERLGGAPDA